MIHVAEGRLQSRVVEGVTGSGDQLGSKTYTRRSCGAGGRCTGKLTTEHQTTLLSAGVRDGETCFTIVHGAVHNIMSCIGESQGVEKIDENRQKKK